VPNDVTHGDEEIRRLRSSINDLIGIQALPTIWDGRESGSIVSTLLDVLVSMLQLDFAYVRLSDSNNGSPVEFVRLAQRRAPPPQALEIGRALDRWLTNQSVNAPLVVPNPAGDGEVKIAPFRLGLTDEIGALVASSKRANFPTPTETLLLRMAANQALVALQEARQLHEQKRAAEELERRVADRTAQLTAANEALRESEKKYRTLFDSIDEGFCTIEVLFDGNDNPIDYRFLEVNPSFEKQTGIQNARGRRMREIAPQHEERWFEIYGRIALTGEPARFENQAAQLRRWYDAYAFRVGDPNDRKVAILFNDITERKQAEAKLLRNEAYLSEAQRLSHTGSFGWNVSSGEIFWSEEAFRIFQFDPKTKSTVELVLQRIHPDDATLVKETLGRASQDGKDFDYEHRLLMPDGSVKHVRIVAHAERDESGELEFVGAVMDVTVAKEAEDKIRLIINTVPGLLWTARPDGWVDFLNQRWLDYTGMNLEQGLGWAWQPGYHPDDLGNLLNKWRAAVAEGKPLETEARLRRFDGEYRWFLKRAFPLLDRAGRVLGWYGGNIDIHDLKQAEEKLRQSESFLSEAQRLSHTGSWAWSVKTKENLFWSKEHYRIYGFDPETSNGQYAAARERVHPKDAFAFDETLQRAVRERSDFEMDHRIVFPGGEVKHIHVVGHPVLNNSGELVEYIGTTMDVTEQVKARAALEEAFSKIKTSEARLRTIIDTIPALAWSSEADGSVEFVNLRWSNYTGLTTEQARGSGWQAAIHPEDVGWLSDQRRITMASGKPFELEARMRRYDGQYRWFINRADPLLDEQGKIVKWYGTNTDIDDRKRAEEALRTSHAALAHVSRLTTMGELTASIAHEVNQPLAAVVNNANACISLLPDGAPNLEEVHEALAEIIEDADRASAVIARVRNLAKRAPIEKSLLDLRDVVKDVLALARYESAARRITIRTDLPADLPSVSGDRVQLQQVLLNLVINGMDSMNTVEESKRVLLIRGHRQTRDGRLETLVSVKDAGTGFKPEEVGRLFEAFYTTKPQGMGMGLAISRSIIEAHSGRLWAEPNQGPGATFLFSLPAVGNAAS
jgi:PAS domain S-box-containing protein